MSSPLIKDSTIINPMARTVLKFEINDQMQAKLDAPGVHPRDAAKMLMSMAIDLLFMHTEAVIDQNKIEDMKKELETKPEGRRLTEV